MNEEKLTPAEDLKVENQTLSGFIEKISRRYFNQEVTVSAEDMQRIADDLAAAGKKEFAQYNIINSARKERKGVGVITIDCSKVVPQENFQRIAEKDKEEKWNGWHSYDLHSGYAFTLGVAIEATRQMLELIKNKPHFRPENKETTHFLQETHRRASGLTRVSSDVADGYQSSICRNLEHLAESLGLKQFTLVFTNTEKIPEYVKKNFFYMQNRPQGENNTRVMLFAKEKSPEDVMQKIHEVRERLSQTGKYRDERNKLVRALDWYFGARTSLAQLEKDTKLTAQTRTHLKDEVIPNQMDSIKSYGYNFYDLDEEFRFFTDDEIKQIKEGIAVL